MRKALPLALAAGALSVAGCATTNGTTPEGGTCDAEGGQSFVGKRATAETGAALLRATGAKQLRWGPPNSAMTMDFRQDRLNVFYNGAMVIERVTCG
jgi:hypothetical protein